MRDELWQEAIRRYRPCNEQERRDQEVILGCLRQFADVLTRECELAHITASAFVINEKRDKALMVHHNIYKAWSWTGGHADGETDLLGVALRELKEETSLTRFRPVFPEIFSLDLLPVLGHVRKGAYVPAHVHLSVAFLVMADDDEMPVINRAENSAVAWLPLEELPLCTEEPHMRALYAKLIEKIKMLPADG